VLDLIGLFSLIYPAQLPYRVEKGGVKMTLFDQYDSKIPDYYNGMYLDGYKPHEILHAVRRKMVQQNEEQGDVGEFKIVSEVKIK